MRPDENHHRGTHTVPLRIMVFARILILRFLSDAERILFARVLPLLGLDIYEAVGNLFADAAQGAILATLDFRKRSDGVRRSYGASIII